MQPTQGNSNDPSTSQSVPKHWSPLIGESSSKGKEPLKLPAAASNSQSYDSKSGFMPYQMQHSAFGQPSKAPELRLEQTTTGMHKSIMIAVLY